MAAFENDIYRRRAFLAAAWVLALVVAGWIGGAIGASGCSENLRAETTRHRVCTSFGLSDFGSRDWLLFATAPALLLIFGLMLPWFRGRPGVVGRALLAALIVFDTAITLLVTR